MSTPIRTEGTPGLRTHTVALRTPPGAVARKLRAKGATRYIAAKYPRGSQVGQPSLQARLNAIYSCRKTMKDPVPYLLKLLYDPNKHIRSAALGQLHNYVIDRFRKQDARLYAPMVKLLSDPDPDRREAAITILANGSYKKAAPKLMKFLYDQRASTRAAAVRALGYLEYKPASTRIIELLKDPKQSLHVHRYAAMAVGRLGDRKAIPHLIPHIDRTKQKDVLTRVNACQSILDLKGRSAVPALMKAADDPAWLVRHGVALALGTFKDPRAIPALIKLLKQHREIARFAEYGLEEIKGPRIMAALKKMLEGKDGYLRRIAGRVLARRKDPQSVSLLIGALGNIDADVRYNALESMYRLSFMPNIRGNMRVIRAVRKCLRDRYWMIRRMAIKLLVELKDWRSLSAIKRLQSDPNEKVREAAKGAVVTLKRHRPWAAGRVKLLGGVSVGTEVTNGLVSRPDGTRAGGSVSMNVGLGVCLNAGGLKCGSTNAWTGMYFGNFLIGLSAYLKASFFKSETQVSTGGQVSVGTRWANISILSGYVFKGFGRGLTRSGQPTVGAKINVAPHRRSPINLYLQLETHLPTSGLKTYVSGNAGVSFGF